MKILILGYGKMGSWFAKELSHTHTIGVVDPNIIDCKIDTNVSLIRRREEVAKFSPDIVINAASLTKVTKAFESIISYLPKECILSDIASIKGNLPTYYNNKGFSYASVHPMFGPTFANIDRLQGEYAIIIEESDSKAATFFRDFFNRFSINILTCPFKEHDTMMAYSLTLPFSLTLTFASIVVDKKYPGTTFAKHFEIARGLLHEEPELIYEVLHTPQARKMLESVQANLNLLCNLLSKNTRENFFEFLSSLNRKPTGHYQQHLSPATDLNKVISRLHGQFEKEMT